jgi:hypothetical protein
MISKKKSAAGKKRVNKLKLNRETLKNLDTKKNVKGGARAADSVLATPWCAPPPDSQKATPWCAPPPDSQKATPWCARNRL